MVCITSSVFLLVTHIFSFAQYTRYSMFMQNHNCSSKTKPFTTGTCISACTCKCTLRHDHIVRGNPNYNTETIAKSQQEAPASHASQHMQATPHLFICLQPYQCPSPPFFNVPTWCTSQHTQIATKPYMMHITKDSDSQEYSFHHSPSSSSILQTTIHAQFACKGAPVLYHILFHINTSPTTGC